MKIIDENDPLDLLSCGLVDIPIKGDGIIRVPINSLIIEFSSFSHKDKKLSDHVMYCNDEFIKEFVLLLKKHDIEFTAGVEVLDVS